jgi:hypothetical protein
VVLKKGKRKWHLTAYQGARLSFEYLNKRKTANPKPSRDHEDIEINTLTMEKYSRGKWRPIYLLTRKI